MRWRWSREAEALLRVRVREVRAVDEGLNLEESGTKACGMKFFLHMYMSMFPIYLFIVYTLPTLVHTPIFRIDIPSTECSVP